MELCELFSMYRDHPGTKALGRMLADQRRRIFLSGAQASSLGVLFASLAKNAPKALLTPVLFVMDDREEAGYLYHDLVQMMDDTRVLFFPSS